MDKNDLLEFANDYFEEKGLTVSPSTSGVLTSGKYLNEKHLSEMKPKEIEANLKILLDEIVTEYKERTSSARKPTKIRDIDARPVIREKFCSLPPFCD